MENNMETFIALKDKYLELIEMFNQKEDQTVAGRKILNALTGFGNLVTCTLCKDVIRLGLKNKHFFTCEACVWNYGLGGGIGCVSRKNNDLGTDALENYLNLQRALSTHEIARLLSVRVILMKKQIARCQQNI